MKDRYKKRFIVNELWSILNNNNIIIIHSNLLSNDDLINFKKNLMSVDAKIKLISNNLFKRYTYCNNFINYIINGPNYIIHIENINNLSRVLKIISECNQFTILGGIILGKILNNITLLWMKERDYISNMKDLVLITSSNNLENLIVYNILKALEMINFNKLKKE